MTPKYKIGDKFKWIEEFDDGSYSVITNIKNGQYIYTIYGATPYKHPGCEFHLVESMTRLLTPLEQFL